jgi:hypothetical protein
VAELGPPVAIGLGFRADQAGGDEAGDGTSELRLGEDGMVDSVGPGDDVKESASARGCSAVY